MRRSILAVLTAAILLEIGFGVYPQQTAQAEAQGAQHLFFHNDWKAGHPPQGLHEVPVTQELVGNPNLTLTLYGPGGRNLEISHVLEIAHVAVKDAPTYLWSGLAEGNWIVTLKDKNSYVDLSTPGVKIRWLVREGGFHLLRPVVKLADGTMLAGDHTDGYTVDWQQAEFPIAKMRWRKLDAVKAVEAPDGKWVDNPDLSKVDEIGFTDLSVGAGHGSGGASRVNWIEVYGNPVPR